MTQPKDWTVHPGPGWRMEEASVKSGEWAEQMQVGDLLEGLDGMRPEYRREYFIAMMRNAFEEALLKDPL